jgi:hypothetical protein
VLHEGVQLALEVAILDSLGDGDQPGLELLSFPLGRALLHLSFDLSLRLQKRTFAAGVIVQ